ncbi:MAG: hypothetical protein KAS32_19270, partial [Candidatus Peribacteraceae bacterium]|nr:hypothetical protein [Candidatus Peribacteraceae bacterium]
EEYKYNNLSKRFSLVRTISNKKVKSTRTDVVIADDPMSGNESFGAPVSKENVEKLKKYFKENPVKNRLMIVAEDTLPVLGGNPEVLEEKTSLDGSDKYYTRSSDEPAILLYQSPEDFNVFFNGNTSLYLSRLPVEISVFDIISVSEYYSDGQLKGVYTNEEVSFFWTPDGETLGVLEVISSDFGRSNMFTVLIKKSGRQTQQEPEQKVITNEDRLRMVMKGLFKDGS